MPTIRLLLLITGNLRTFSVSMCRTALARSSSSRQQCISAVITSRAVVPLALKLSSANPLHTISRSQNALHAASCPAEQISSISGQVSVTRRSVTLVGPAANDNDKGGGEVGVG